MRAEALMMLTGFLELALFFVAFLFLEPVSTAALVLLLGLSYWWAVRECIPLSEDEPMEVLKKNISLPAFLLLFYVFGLDPSIKMAVIAFGAQAAMKAMAAELTSSCGKQKPSSEGRARRSFFSSILRS